MSPPATSPSLEPLRTLAPAFIDLSERVLFGEVWQRPGLSPRDRSLVTVAALAALGRTAQLPFHLELAERNGLARAELSEAMTHLAFYAGWPAAVSALQRLAAADAEAR
ncbi:carboxymuconolactone decarboxylase family protein [[Pseudomonas] boreopolis]|uniref:carboxymuconolactone decarboxylase family protein n=1 Tax=Xanthomonas boreopolis TaxID=86183 RepID=UPI003D5A81BF